MLTGGTGEQTASACRVRMHVRRQLPGRSRRQQRKQRGGFLRAPAGDRGIEGIRPAQPHRIVCRAVALDRRTQHLKPGLKSLLRTTLHEPQADQPGDSGAPILEIIAVTPARQLLEVLLRGGELAALQCQVDQVQMHERRTWMTLVALQVFPTQLLGIVPVAGEQVDVHDVRRRQKAAEPLAATAIRGQRRRQVTLRAGQIPEHADVAGVVLAARQSFDVAVALGDFDLGGVVEHGLLMPTGVEQRDSVSTQRFTEQPLVAEGLGRRQRRLIHRVSARVISGHRDNAPECRVEFSDVAVEFATIQRGDGAAQALDRLGDPPQPLQCPADTHDQPQALAPAAGLLVCSGSSFKQCERRVGSPCPVGHLSGGLVELRTLALIVAELTRLRVQPLCDIGCADRAGPLAGTAQCRHSGHPQIGGVVILARCTVGREVVRGDHLGDLLAVVGKSLSEVRGRGQVAGLALAAREQLIRDRAQEPLRPPIVAPVRGEWIGANRQDLLADEALERGIELIARELGQSGSSLSVRRRRRIPTSP